MRKLQRFGTILAIWTTLPIADAAAQFTASAGGNYYLMGWWLNASGEFDASLGPQNGTIDAFGVLSGRKSLTSYFNPGKSLTGRVSARIASGELGLAISATSTAVYGFSGIAASATIATYDEVTLEWNLPGPPPSIGNDDFRLWLDASANLGFKRSSDDGGSAVGGVTFTVGAESKTFVGEVNSLTGNFFNLNLSPTFQYYVPYNGTPKKTFGFGITCSLSVDGAGGLCDSGRTLKLRRIEFLDGTTPESHGFDLVFASGMISPNLRQDVELYADFDENGLVDGQDLLIWQRNVGMTFDAFHIDGDADGDNDVDQDDLAVWKSEFAPAEATVVPEPAAALLVVAGAALLLPMRRRRDAHAGRCGRRSRR